MKKIFKKVVIGFLVVSLQLSTLGLPLFINIANAGVNLDFPMDADFFLGSPMAVIRANSSAQFDKSLARFALSADAGETLDSVAVTVNEASGTVGAGEIDKMYI